MMGWSDCCTSRPMSQVGGLRGYIKLSSHRIQDSCGEELKMSSGRRSKAELPAHGFDKVVAFTHQFKITHYDLTRRRILGRKQNRA